MRSGVCQPIPPTEILAWVTINKHIITSREHAILRAMDDAYCSGVNAELADFRERQKEAMQREAEAAKRGKGNR